MACTGKSALRLKKPFFTSLAYISDAVLALHKRAKLLVESQAAGVAENPYNACTLEKSQARGMLRVSRTIPLRAKFLLSMLAVSAGLTAATLGVVSYHVEKGVRESIHAELRNSVKTYQTLALQQNATMMRSAALLANLPNVRALMTTEDSATIQNESPEIWKLAGSDLLVLADRRGGVVAVQSKTQGFEHARAQVLMQQSLDQGHPRGWWSSDGHLYEVWLQPIYFGAASHEMSIGCLAVGHEIDAEVAREFGSVVSSEIVFRNGNEIVASTLSASDAKTMLQSHVPPAGVDAVEDLQVGKEHFLASTIGISNDTQPPVTITVLKSLDKATAFLQRLNGILLALGVLSVVSGGVLVFVISHTFTKPLANLVAGVRALAEGNFDFPLSSAGNDEVGEVTSAFYRMRANLRSTQLEQKQLEERLRQAHKMEGIGRLAGGVAHDFNNLLTIIRGNSDLLLDRGTLEAVQTRNVEQIQKASNRAVSMTRQLLAFSRMQVMQPRALDLNQVISEMSKMVPRLIGEDIEFSFEPGDELATVVADPGQIEQVFLNLAVNARDAMPSGGALKVRTANVVIDQQEARNRPPMTAGSYVLLAVSDTGAGMDPETKARIFEPFFTTKEVGKGTGLGLATVYGIVKQSGGFIWVASEQGKGSTFEVYLAASNKVAETATMPTKQELPGGTETILVVEDEREVRELACEFLRSSGYNVLEASNGEEALRIEANHAEPIHLLLTDKVMPRMPGEELAKRMSLLRADLRIVFMTGYSEFSTNGNAGPASEIHVIQKPFSRVSLLERLREVLTATPVKAGRSSIE